MEARPREGYTRSPLTRSASNFKPYLMCRISYATRLQWCANVSGPLVFLLYFVSSCRPGEDIIYALQNGKNDGRRRGTAFVTFFLYTYARDACTRRNHLSTSEDRKEEVRELSRIKACPRFIRKSRLVWQKRGQSDFFR